MQAVCVFCGSRPGARPEYLELAGEVGRALAARSISLVYGGASVGMMGRMADAALAAGGRVIGVIPRALVDREIAHAGLSELLVVDTLHQRKALMAERSDAFVALPGGVGTLDELFEVITWRVLGLHDKPIGLVDAGGYFDLLAVVLDRMVAEGFFEPRHRAFVLHASSPDELFDRLAESP